MDPGLASQRLIKDLAVGDPGTLSLVERILRNLRQSGLLDDTENSGIDVKELEREIEKLGDSVTIYFINSGVPGNEGEGDNDGDGLIDEELLDGLNNDGDEHTDEDAVFQLAGVDDDGDGLIGEDPFDMIDNDNDGLIDEDRN